MSALHLRRAWNEHTCVKCGVVFDGQFAICPACSARVARINAARELIAEAEAERERPFPPPRPRPLP